MDEQFGSAAMAIVVADHGELRTLLAAQPNLTTERSSVGHPTLLQLVACEAANLPEAIGSAKVLVNAGASVDEPLIAAAGCGNWLIAEFLIDSGADIDTGEHWSPLDEALYWDNLDIAGRLVARGAAIRGLSTAAGLGDASELDRFFTGESLADRAGPIGSPFPDTIPPDRASNHQDLLDHAFVMAVNNGKQETAATLLGRGAEVNAMPPGFHWHGAAIHAAAWRGDDQLMRWLLANGADPSLRDGMVHSDATGWARHHGNDHLLTLLS